MIDDDKHFDTPDAKKKLNHISIYVHMLCFLVIYVSTRSDFFSFFFLQKQSNDGETRFDIP